MDQLWPQKCPIKEVQHRKAWSVIARVDLSISKLWAISLSKGSSIYPKTIAGLIDCFVMAIPFLKNSLTGDLLYTFLFFGAYEIVTATLKKPAPIQK